MRELVPIKQPTQSTRLNAMTIIRPIHKNEYLCSNAVCIGMRSSTTVDSRVQPADNYKTSSLHRQKKNYILCINISSFGCFTILVHRNVKLLYKYVGPLASKNYPLYLLTNSAGSFGGYTILLHRNVILLYKYVGPLELMLCGYEGRLTLRFLKNLPPLILRWHLYSSTQKYQLIL